MPVRESRRLPFHSSSSKGGPGPRQAKRLPTSSSSRTTSEAIPLTTSRSSRTLPPSTLPTYRGCQKAQQLRKGRALKVKRVLEKAKNQMPPRSGGVLRRVAVTLPVAWTYHTVLAEFFLFAAFWGLTPDLKFPEQAETLDQAASEYCDHMYMEGHQAYIGERLFAALQDSYTALNQAGSVKLPEFYRTRQAWRRRAPGRSRAPLSLTQVLLVVGWFVSRGLLPMALWILVCFTTYYRPSEVFSLKVGDLLRPTSRLPHHLLQLHPGDAGVSSKARVFDDGVPLDSPILKWLPGALIKHLRLSRRKAQENMFLFTYGELLHQFKLACSELQIKDASLYRLRHGGASHDAAARLRTIAEIKRRGRWASDRSVRRYEKRTWLHSEEVKVSPTLEARAQRIEEGLPELFGVSRNA